ncbi:hypothetical protein LTR84_001660 [Exophiala bonariae]|uniref:EamA domain-containing protein n=1 Tax=Exophiala bonariae TaxID=1690606 RepID=A0AAV9NBA1_9EURO|nr:hypothetical protein LTR84_001660 [Exophiala bonariae]
MPKIMKIGQWASPAYIAAAILVVIQVAIGLLFKAVQVKGAYSFSTSASITISEFLKLGISTALFGRTCLTRFRDQKRGYQFLEDNNTLLHDYNDKRVSEDSEAPSSSSLEPTAPGCPDEEFHVKTSHRQGDRYISYFVSSCIHEVSKEHIIAYGHLALLYALINNTVFVAFRLADPGTIQLVKSGITLITAITSLLLLGTRIMKLQWMGIALQVVGLIVTQYHEGSGLTYPLPTYLVLLLQTGVSAVAGVLNQFLCKSQPASLHAQNMVLYGFGTLTNGIVHIAITFLNPNEPGFFQGYNQVGAFLVIASNVLLGLAITAVYKYADAVVKCFATAFSTAILLYLAPFLFDVKFSALVIPGTLVVFMATWLYIETAMKPAATHAQPEAATNEKASSSCRLELLVSVITLPKWGPLGLSIAGIVFAGSIATINTWKIEGYQKQHDNVETSTADMANNQSHRAGVKSPFANTLGFVRWNEAYLERIPLIQKYDPFFHTIHYSIPNYVADPPTGGKFVIVTHSSWDNHENVYIPVADTMALILNDTEYSSIEGLLFFHFDLWINPLEFTFMDYDRIWSTYITHYKSKEAGNGWHWWDVRPLWEQGTSAIAALNGTQYDKTVEVCANWADVYYVPRKYFSDFIYLSHLVDPMFHESAIPTMFNIIDRTYRQQDAGKEYVNLADCWGGCCASNPTPEDIMWARCGHRLNYLDPDTTVLHYMRLDRQVNTLQSIEG